MFRAKPSGKAPKPILQNKDNTDDGNTYQDVSLHKKGKLIKVTPLNTFPIEVVYFDVNKERRRVRLKDDETVYSGYHLGINESWKPFGKGKYHINDQPLLSATFNQNGFGQGYGEYNFYHKKVLNEEGFYDNERELWSVWKGHLENGNISGQGKFLYHTNDNDKKVETGIDNLDDDSNEVLCRNNAVVCTKDDLMIGRQIELSDFSLQVYGETKCVFIIKHIKDWIYRIRYYDDVKPRERNVSNCLIYNMMK